MNGIIITAVITLGVIICVLTFIYANYKVSKDSSANEFYKIVDKIKADTNFITKTMKSIADNQQRITDIISKIINKDN